MPRVVVRYRQSDHWQRRRRERRVLWDQFHSLRYPPGYLPRDALEVRPHVPYNSFHTV